MRKVLAFLFGFAAGALVAGSVVLLITPQSGEEVRSTLRARFDELMEEGRQAAETRRRELEAQLAAFKQGGPVVIE